MAEQTVDRDPNPLDVEGVRLACRASLQEQLDAQNKQLRQKYEGALFLWKGEAERAAGEYKPVPVRPPVPLKFVLADDDKTWNFQVLQKGEIEFTDVTVSKPYDKGFFPPRDFMGVDPYSGLAYYNAHPGDQHPHGAEYKDSRGIFRKVIASPFHVQGGGFWFKIA